MKSDDLFNAINGIDDDIIRESDTPYKHCGIRICRGLCTAAASVVLAVGLTAAICSYAPDNTLKDEHNSAVASSPYAINTDGQAASASIPEKTYSSEQRETSPVTTYSNTSCTYNKENDTDVMETESPDVRESDANIPSEYDFNPDTDKNHVDADGLVQCIDNEDLSGIALDEWLNDASVIWDENDHQDTKDPLAAYPGTAVISPELRALFEKYPDDGIVFAVAADFSFVSEETAPDDPKTDYSEKLNDFQETFKWNGLAIYPCGNGSDFFYTFGTAAHFEEFVCSENETFIFRPAGEIR